MKTQKVKLKQLEVQSFVTLLDAKKLKGGDSQVPELGTLNVCSGSGSPC